MSNIVSLLMAVGILLVSTLSHAVDPRPKFILDLDHMIWHKIEPSRTEGIPPSELLYHGKWAYRVRDGAREYIQALGGLGDVIFFSTGFEDRNLSLLKQLMVGDGKTSAYEAAQGRVFSEIHLDEGKKNLLAAVRESDLPGTFLLDDTAENALPSQIKSLVWAPNRWEKGGFVESFIQALPRLSTEEARKLAADFQHDRNKLAIYYGMMEDAIHQAKTSDAALQDIVQANRARLDRDPGEMLRLFRKGVRRFKELNPRYRVTSLLSGLTRKECVQAQLEAAR